MKKNTIINIHILKHTITSPDANAKVVAISTLRSSHVTSRPLILTVTLLPIDFNSSKQGCISSSLLKTCPIALDTIKLTTANVPAKFNNNDDYAFEMM